MDLKKIGNVIGGFAILLSVWQIVLIMGNYSESLFPSPLGMLKGLWELMRKGVLWKGIAASMMRLAWGYLSAAVAGIGLGLFLGWFQGIWKFINPIVQLLRPISPIAWSPFIVLWFGIGDLPAIVIVFIAAFFPILLTTISAVKKVDRVYLKVAKNFGMNQWQTITKIIFPSAFPQIATGLHLALGTSWIFIVAGEMIGAQSGLGFLIVDSRNNLRADLLMAAIVVIGLLGLLLDGGIRLLEKWVFDKWGIISD